MKPFVGLLLVCGLAYGGIIPSTHVVSSQYHAQNELGEYSYGYAGGPSSKQETKTADGVTRGGYSYIDGHGLVQSAAYVSDDLNGFRVAATNLPVGPAVPTGEVIEQAVAVAPATVAVGPAPVAVAPAPVALAPAPVAIAQPEPVAFAPAPVAVAPAPEAIAPAPAPIAPLPAPVAPVEPAAIAPAPIAPAADYYDDSTVIESADVALAKSAPAAPVYTPPVSVSETLAVSNARAAHLAAVEQTKARDALQASIDAAHLAAVEQTRARDALQASIDAAQLYATAPLLPAPVVEGLPAVVTTAAVAPAPVAAVVRTAAVAPAPVVAAAPAVVAAAPVAAVAPVAVGVTASQYHAQNELGEYSYGYAGGPSAKEEIKTADGITRGGYSYLDAHGLVQSASYVSDPHNGFRVAATNLPVQPAPTYLADTPEVAHAKAKLFQAQAEHIAKL